MRWTCATSRCGAGRLAIRFKVAGSGPPLVYLHPAAGLHFDPFLEALSADYTIFAPEHPGTGEGDSEAIHLVDDLWDLVLIYDEAIRALGLEGPVVAIGQSFGGMMAAELAAHDPGCSRGSRCSPRSASGARICRSPTGS